MYYVYVIKSSEGRYYIGSTQDVEKRLKQHNAPANRGWTNRFTGWIEVYREEWGTRLDARRRERELKKMTGKKRERMLNGLPPDSGEYSGDKKKTAKDVKPASRPKKAIGRKGKEVKLDKRTSEMNTDTAVVIRKEKTAGGTRKPGSRRTGTKNAAAGKVVSTLKVETT
jgi:putative endonuclease